MKARFSLILTVAVSMMLSGCVAYSSIGGQYSPTGTDDLMSWAKGAGGTVVHGRGAQCRRDWYGQMYCQPFEWASSVNVQYGVSPAQSGGPAVYIEKPAPAVTNTNVPTKPK